MGELLAFHQPKTTLRASREPASASAEIIFFPGVRYERLDETRQQDTDGKPVSSFPDPALKPSMRRAARRREKPKKEKAS
jgi:hypothetical protein